MGNTGPCGPCTEIHYDRIGNRDARSLVNADRPDVIEIWNNVFIQFNREADGSLKELPSKHVDTGMGFERLASILQDKDSNYDTDVFAPIFDEIQKVSGCRLYTRKLGADDSDLVDTAYRVVADHIRTLTFAITDGAIPSNEGRGYVLRRILRRAVRYGQEMLNAPNGFFAKLVGIVVKTFSDAFPELAQREEFVRSIITEEEQSFTRTLDQGVKHFKKVVTQLQASGTKEIPAKDAHLLFTSMGFPLDLTELMAAEQGLRVDKMGFEALMENDRKISEAAEAQRKGISDKDLSMAAEQTAWLADHSVVPTATQLKYEWNITPQAVVKAIFVGKGTEGSGFIDHFSKKNDLIGIILDQSSFYYESGGQTYDTGALISLDGKSRFEVSNVQIFGGYVLHLGHLVSDGTITAGEEVRLIVDYERRSCIAPNHTMTHVLNYALRKVLVLKNPGMDSSQCEQKGSLVDSEKLRFDFSWSTALTVSEISAIESIVVDVIKTKLPVDSCVVPLSTASGISSLRKVFGEAYPDPVRVISVGAVVDDLIKDPLNEQWFNVSVEFCGGTHLTNTSQAEDFVIVEESGIAKGIRRIVAFTKTQASLARSRANSLLSKLKNAELLPDSQELVLAYKNLRREVNF
jgi:alanyl-tRNA synthetase